MLHAPTNTKRYSHACEYYIVYTTKVPNIVTVLLVTVYPMSDRHRTTLRDEE